MYGDGLEPDESAKEASGWVGSYVEAIVFQVNKEYTFGKTNKDSKV